MLILLHETLLSVNVTKTKIVIFINGGNIEFRNNEKWRSNCELTKTWLFIYLGLLLQYNGQFNNTQKQLASPGGKAMFSVSSKNSQLFLNTENLLSLFETYVSFFFTILLLKIMFIDLYNYKASIFIKNCIIWGIVST